MMKADLYTIKDIIRENRDGEFLAICDNGKEYKASYDAKYRAMFFAIPCNNIVFPVPYAVQDQTN